VADPKKKTREEPCKAVAVAHVWNLSVDHNDKVVQTYMVYFQTVIRRFHLAKRGFQVRRRGGGMSNPVVSTVFADATQGGDADC
jgi:hypothetical protein